MTMYQSQPTAGSAKSMLSSRRGRQDLTINPVIRTFYAKFNQFKFASGKIVLPGTPLHQHKDGAILTGEGTRKDDTSALVIPIKYTKPTESTEDDANFSTNSNVPSNVGQYGNIYQSSPDYTYTGGDPYNIDYKKGGKVGKSDGKKV